MRSKYCPMPSAACGKCALVAARAAAKPCGIKKGFSNSGLLTSCRSPTSTNGMSRSRPSARRIGPLGLLRRAHRSRAARLRSKARHGDRQWRLRRNCDCAQYENPVAGAGERARGQAAQPRPDPRWHRNSATSAAPASRGAARPQDRGDAKQDQDHRTAMQPHVRPPGTSARSDSIDWRRRGAVDLRQASVRQISRGRRERRRRSTTPDIRRSASTECLVQSLLAGRWCGFRPQGKRKGVAATLWT